MDNYVLRTEIIRDDYMVNPITKVLDKYLLSTKNSEVHLVKPLSRYQPVVTIELDGQAVGGVILGMNSIILDIKINEVYQKDLPDGYEVELSKYCGYKLKRFIDIRNK